MGSLSRAHTLARKYMYTYIHTYIRIYIHKNIESKSDRVHSLVVPLYHALLVLIVRTNSHIRALVLSLVVPLYQ